MHFIDISPTDTTKNIKKGGRDNLWVFNCSII